MLNYADYENTKPYESFKKNKAIWQAYQDEKQRIYLQFKQDVFAELDIEDNPKRDLLFDKAWERGHACGLHEVFMYAEDLVELIRD
jgi:hypothetical protein